MGLQLNRTRCCGLRELHGIQDDSVCVREGVQEYKDLGWGFLPVWKVKPKYATPTAEDIIKFVQDQMFNNGRDSAFITFAAACFKPAKNKYNEQGVKLAAYIRKKKLGTLSVGKAARNPNSGHNLRVWLWRVDRVAMRKWKPT